LLTLGAWREQHPNSLIALPPEKWTGLMPLEVVNIVLERATRSGVPPDLTPQDRRLLNSTPIIGLAYQGTARACPLLILEQQGVIQDQLGDAPVELRYDASSMLVTLESSNRDQILFRQTWWNEWYEFYSQTGVYQRSKVTDEPTDITRS
jgi:hypothetical protein